MSKWSIRTHLRRVELKHVWTPLCARPELCSLISDLVRREGVQHLGDIVMVVLLQKHSYKSDKDALLRTGPISISQVSAYSLRGYRGCCTW